MRFVFAANYLGTDPLRGSGTFYALCQELERQGHILHYIAPQTAGAPFPSRVIRGVSSRLGKRNQTYLDPFVSRMRGEDISQQIKHLNYDVFLTNDYGLAAYTKTSKPVITYTDAMVPYHYRNKEIPPYSAISNLWWFSVLLYQWTIHRGMAHSRLCLFPTEWLANEGKQYIRDKSKIAILPFGANVDDPGKEVTTHRSLPKSDALELLFVGKDWRRKGGAIAIETALELTKRGILTHLYIVGTEVPCEVDPAIVKAYGYLDKNNSAEAQRLYSLFKTAQFFLMPSQFEGLAIAFLEAAAFGLPVIAYNIHGAPTAARDGKSGLLLEPGATAQDFADKIMELLNDPARYQTLVMGAREYYETTANWPMVARRLVEAITRVV